jgi:hypothetical protein
VSVSSQGNTTDVYGATTLVVTPSDRQTYELTASNADAQVTASVTVAACGLYLVAGSSSNQAGTVDGPPGTNLMTGVNSIVFDEGGNLLATGGDQVIRRVDSP